MDWRGRRVFLTGHTGFKGAWLALWLERLGALVRGYSLPPPTSPSLFESAEVARGIDSVHGDIRDGARLAEQMRAFAPEVVFHLAAQPLVRLSYREPLETYATNVMGTANLLEAVRGASSVRAVVIVTTDKCYENREWRWPYRENDRLGGYDPYSSSKAMAELVAASYRSSFFPPASYGEHGVALATARAGNVIGGGDWAPDRLVPDIIRAFQAGEPVRIRHPRAVRPWQHVLEPLRGYLLLAEALVDHGCDFSGAWNFGPRDRDALPVERIVQGLAAAWGEHAHWQADEQIHVHEAEVLRLDCSKASAELGWDPTLTIDDALRMTASWYAAFHKSDPVRVFTLDQISAYEQLSLSTSPREQIA